MATLYGRLRSVLDALYSRLMVQPATSWLQWDLKGISFCFIQMFENPRSATITSAFILVSSSWKHLKDLRKTEECTWDWENVLVSAPCVSSKAASWSHLCHHLCARTPYLCQCKLSSWSYCVLYWRKKILEVFLAIPNDFEFPKSICVCTYTQTLVLVLQPFVTVNRLSRDKRSI